MEKDLCFSSCFDVDFYWTFLLHNFNSQVETRKDSKKLKNSAIESKLRFIAIRLAGISA